MEQEYFKIVFTVRDDCGTRKHFNYNAYSFEHLIKYLLHFEIELGCKVLSYKIYRRFTKID